MRDQGGFQLHFPRPFLGEHRTEQCDLAPDHQQDNGNREDLQGVYSMALLIVAGAVDNFKTNARPTDLQFIAGSQPALPDRLAVDAYAADAVEIVEVVTVHLALDGGVPPAYAGFDELNVARCVATDDERRQFNDHGFSRRGSILKHQTVHDVAPDDTTAWRHAHGFSTNVCGHSKCTASREERAFHRSYCTRTLARVISAPPTNKFPVTDS